VKQKELARYIAPGDRADFLTLQLVMWRLNCAPSLLIFMEVGDDHSIALGTETLADRDIVSPNFDYIPDSPADILPIEIFEHRRFPERNALADDTIKACGFSAFLIR
jgi:hypothetical protein